MNSSEVSLSLAESPREEVGGMKEGVTYINTNSIKTGSLLDLLSLFGEFFIWFMGLFAKKKKKKYSYIQSFIW